MTMKTAEQIAAEHGSVGCKALVDWIKEIQSDALEAAAIVVLNGPFAGDRNGDAAAIRRLKPVKL